MADTGRAIGHQQSVGVDIAVGRRDEWAASMREKALSYLPEPEHTRQARLARWQRSTGNERHEAPVTRQATRPV